MTTVHQIFTIRSFRSANDRDYLKAIQIYSANIPARAKTDSNEIAHWLKHGADTPEGKFYVCGLYVSGNLVGYVEFIYLKRERLIHFDYFVIDRAKRTAGAFYTFAEQMKSFFDQEKLEWDYATAEVTHLDEVNGISRVAQGLVRLFRQVGFYEVVADYFQPQLGYENPDTVLKATLLLLPRVEMATISRSRLLELVSAIYYKHYVRWYSIYNETGARYREQTDALFKEFECFLGDKKEIALRGPEQDFVEGPLQSPPPLQGAIFYLAKIVLSGIAAGAIPFFLRHHSEFPRIWLVVIPASVFVLLAATVSLADKRRFEAFKLLVSLCSKFFDR